MTLKQNRFKPAETKSIIVQVSNTSFLVAKQLKKIFAIMLKTRPEEKIVPRKLT